jgi:hypothetical protein
MSKISISMSIEVVCNECGSPVVARVCNGHGGPWIEVRPCTRCELAAEKRGREEAKEESKP